MALMMNDVAKHDRPRERLLTSGVETLGERELLALVLRSGSRGESAIDLAAKLLSTFGGIDGLHKALPEELSSIPGIGPAKAAGIVASFRLANLARFSTRRDVIRCADDIARIARPELISSRRERVVILICDSQNRLQKIVRLSDGSANQALMPVREALNAVLRHDGCAFAIAHNHPGGNLEPSEADYQSTRAIASAAKTVGLRFIDHVIVTHDNWTSVPNVVVALPLNND